MKKKIIFSIAILIIFALSIISNIQGQVNISNEIEEKDECSICPYLKNVKIKPFNKEKFCKIFANILALPAVLFNWDVCLSETGPGACYYKLFDACMGE